MKRIDELIFKKNTGTLVVPVERDELIELLIEFYNESRQYGVKNETI